MHNGKLSAIPARDGRTTIPSVLNIGEGNQLLVGHQARRRSLTHPESTIFGAKRLMGRLFGTPEMSQIQTRFCYEIVESDHQEPLVGAGDKMLSLEEIAAVILGEVKDAAEAFIEQKVEYAVISVPAYFTQRQRQSVREAGRLAGLNVTRVINEPTAAAIAVANKKRWGQKRLLVYDLGGGTFDVSIMTVKNNVYEVVGTCGNSFLGGIDFDNMLIDRMCEGIEAEHGVNLRANAVAQQRLRDAAETARAALSKEGRTEINLPYLAEIDGKRIDYRLALTRPALEEMCVPLVNETLKYVSRALAEAGLEKKNIDEVVMVGGMTRMPLIQRAVATFFGKPPTVDVDPDLSIAHGAAILGHAIRYGTDGNMLRDILSVSIGIALPDGKFQKVVNKNSTLPTQKTISVRTSRDLQDRIPLRIFQGESRMVENNELLGEVTIFGVPPLPKGKAQVDVTFDLDTDAILHITAIEKSTGRKIDTTLITDGSVHRKSHRS